MRKLKALLLCFGLVLTTTIQSQAQALETFPLEAALSDHKNLPGLSKYSFSTEYFKLLILTPVSGYRIAINNKNKSVYSKHKLSIKDPNITKDEKLDEIGYWSPFEDKVTVIMVPQPQTKNIVKAGRFFGYLTAFAFTVGTLGIGMATLGLPGKIKGYKVSKDFFKTRLETKKKKAVCESEMSDVTLMDDVSRVHFFPDDQYEDFINKLYMGVFEFDPNCFMNEDVKKLIIRDKEDHKVLTISLKKSLLKAIKQDFFYMPKYQGVNDAQD